MTSTKNQTRSFLVCPVQWRVGLSVGFAIGLACLLSSIGCEQTNVSQRTSVPIKADGASDAPKISPRVTVKKEPIPSKQLKWKPKATDLNEPFVGPNGKTYLPNQLHKNQTLLVLAAQPDIRAKLVVAPYRTIISKEKYNQALQIALSYDPGFEAILRERAEILESAFDGGNVEEQLLYVKMKTADLLVEVRRKISQTVLSKAEVEKAIEAWQEAMAKEKPAS